jgi:SAM-dependent methyltransferase
MFRDGLLQYWWMLYRHSKVLGQRTDIFRNVEDAFTAKHGALCLRKESIYLDIGSGSSPVPTFLHQLAGCTTYATELDPVYLARQREFCGKLRGAMEARFFIQPEDATRLSFPDTSIDLISAISTIEHIPGDGDTRSMAEFARVLRPGGRLVVTVPTDIKTVENQSTLYYRGFERRYDPAALQQRLYRSDLRIIDELYMVSPPHEFVVEFQQQFQDVLHGESWTDVWYKNGWHDQYPDVSILLTLGLVRLSHNPDGSFGACLMFEKS